MRRHLRAKSEDDDGVGCGAGVLGTHARVAVLPSHLQTPFVLDAEVQNPLMFVSTEPHLQMRFTLFAAAGFANRIIAAIASMISLMETPSLLEHGSTIAGHD